VGVAVGGVPVRVGVAVGGVPVRVGVAVGSVPVMVGEGVPDAVAVIEEVGVGETKAWPASFILAMIV
jgi:hypothetical protein